MGQSLRKVCHVKHSSFTVSYYHLFQISVSQGQAVLSGDVVGITGNTGRCTEEHLHITCKYKGSIINPILIVDYIAHITMIPWI
ncbi:MULTISPECIES: M23 family metallopeptidase [Bacteroides]|uniref:M23 family metallopeptidase n=1 Tax=Bacteroides TaxID=816 RepID=UPI00286DC6D8|nr:peptidoglycan DD-metalloendopeptidase family protein [Bacteroides thetaiotaomicron]